MRKKFLVGLLVLNLLAGLAWGVVINGAGATFPYPIYMKWNSEFAKKENVQINYQPIGSGGGIRQFSSNVVDFGGTDSAMTDQEIAQAGGNILHIPTVMGAVAVSYNLPKMQNLKMDSEVLSDIFMGKIKKWNDPAIAALNPSSALPDRTITVVYRSDGSGTTSIFTSYLAKINTAWASQVGAGKAVSWPVGIGGKGNSGVAGAIKMNEGAMGYIELSYAISNNLPTVILKNKAGKFISPDLVSTSAAAAGALSSNKFAKMVRAGDFRMDLTNAPGVNSYPIVGLTWILARAENPDRDKAVILKNYLKWALTSGQEYAADLLYAPLPDNMAKEAVKLIDKI